VTSSRRDAGMAGSVDRLEPEIATEDLAKNLRADARRNRGRILEAAEEVFGAEGLSVPIDDIAERAGVGVGTIYRHFPTKEALFEAIVLNHIERLAEEARSLATAEDPARALFEFMARVVEEAVAKRDLADALAGAGIDLKETVSPMKQQLESAVGELLVRAQLAGTVRDDITIADLLGLVSGACMTIERHTDPRSPGRMLQVVCDGLRLPTTGAIRQGT